MAKTRSKKRRFSRFNGGQKVPLAIIAGLAPGMVWAASNPEHSFRQAMERIVYSYAGIVTWENRPRFEGGGLKYGLYPLLGGVFAHWLANVTGLNRLIRRIPYVQV